MAKHTDSTNPIVYLQSMKYVGCSLKCAAIGKLPYMFYKECEILFVRRIQPHKIC